MADRPQNKNLISLGDRTPEEKSAIAKKGAIASSKKRREIKKQKEQRKTIVDTLKDVLYSDVKNKKILQMLDKNGISGEQNYLVAMIASSVLKGVQHGRLTDVLRLIEVLEGSATEKIEITSMDKTIEELQSYLSSKNKKHKKDNENV